MLATDGPVLSRREKQAGGCRAAVVEPDVSPERAIRLARALKALGDPTRLQIVDVLRKSAPEALCQCELVPLFDMSQPALAKHLKVLIGAGIVGTERRGLWAYYFLTSGALEEALGWMHRHEQARSAIVRARKPAAA